MNALEKADKRSMKHRALADMMRRERDKAFTAEHSTAQHIMELRLDGIGWDGLARGMLFVNPGEHKEGGGMGWSAFVFSAFCFWLVVWLVGVACLSC